jgi:phosphatidylserine/phosphatidylglycerophosphate/cardiolipin synthase-like enzyme
MNKQSQWLFEAPPISESVFHSNQEYYSNPEWELQVTNPYALSEEEWERSPVSSPREQTIRETISGFPRYSNAIPPQERAKIARIAQMIVQSYSSGQPIRTVRMVGHADRDVQRGANFEKKISGDRALEVQKALIKAINNPRISSRIQWQRDPVGASQLIVQNPTTEQDRLRNRRVEMIVVASAQKPPTVTSDRWKPAIGGAKVRSGNQVEFLIDGRQTFEAMVRAIKTATGSQHYIYLLGWWLTDSFPLIPGDPYSTITRLFAAAAKRGVQIRVMLWDQFGTQNSPEVRQINALRMGGAILDNETLNFGSHHQKVLVVKGSQGLISFCGGVDINPDRIVASSGSRSGSSGGQGTPLHDVHSQIRGPAAHDLLNVFVHRWFAHPEHTKIDATKGALLGLREPIPAAIGNHNVRIARTFNLITATKCQKARSIKSVLIGAIRAARKFIYIEDQYLVNMEAAAELKKALPNIQHLTIIIPHSSISDMPQVWARRKAFIDILKSGPHAHKVRVFYLVNPTTGGFGPFTYVHAKMWVIDDELAVIGSANCNRRGWSHDSEVIAAIYDATPNEQPRSSLAHRLRMTLWGRHLNVPLSAVRDGVVSASLWLKPPAGAWVRPYNQNSGQDPAKDKLISWDSFVDPSGDHLPACSGGIETETDRLITA